MNDSGTVSFLDLMTKGFFTSLMAVVIANGIISVDVPGFNEKKTEYINVLKKADSIPRNLEYASRALEPYEEYLD